MEEGPAKGLGIDCGPREASQDSEPESESRRCVSEPAQAASTESVQLFKQQRVSYSSGQTVEVQHQGAASSGSDESLLPGL